MVLLDHADNVGSGGTEDCMTVIAAVLDRGLRDVAVAAVWDPGAVAEMAEAGVGAEVTLDLGGKTDMPSVGETGRPLRLTGRVRALTDGRWTVRGPMYTGSEVSTGQTGVFETGGVKIVVVSKHHEPWDLGIFTSVGIEPQHCHYLLLKSRIHYRAGFAALAKATIACDGTGVTTSDNARLAFEKSDPPDLPFGLAPGLELAAGSGVIAGRLAAAAFGHSFREQTEYLVHHGGSDQCGVAARIEGRRDLDHVAADQIEPAQARAAGPGPRSWSGRRPRGCRCPARRPDRGRRRRRRRRRRHRPRRGAPRRSPPRPPVS